MADSKDELTPRQRRALAAILTERDAISAAQAAGVGYRSLARWLTMPVFRDALRQAEDTLLDAATRRLLNLTGAAIETLGDGMDAPRAGDRLRAAALVLDYTLRLRELGAIERRLTELEAMIYGKQNGRAN